MNCVERVNRRACDERDRASKDGAGRELERAALASHAGLLRGYGAASRERDAQLRTISARALGPGMRTAAGQSHSPAVAGLEVTPGEVTGELRCEALAGESEPADEGVAGWGLPGSQGEFVGFWESRSGQESFVVCARPGGDLNPRPKNQIHDLCPAGAGSAGRKTGTAVAPGNQKTGEVRRPDYRSNGIRAAKPRGDGSPVHALGGALRTWQCAADQQSAVFPMGGNLQRYHDDGRRD